MKDNSPGTDSENNINSTLLDIVLTQMGDGQDKYYFNISESKSRKGVLNTKEVLIAFAGGVPADRTLKELSESYYNDIKEKNRFSLTGLAECFFGDFLKAERFMDILNAIHNGIMVTDQNGIVTFINPAYTQLTGLRAQDIVGRKLANVRPSARLPEVIKSGKPLYGVHRKVANIEYIVDMHPIFVNGEVMGGVTIARDITELQNLMGKLQKYRVTVNALTGRIKEQHKAKFIFEDIVGQSLLLKEAKQLAQKVAKSDINVLILGESGTGKELFAHAIHNDSMRRWEAFVVVNCASIPKALLESELFGYEPGAFTGANKSGKLGLLEIADLGTLFLDEIGDMDIELQAKILRAIQLGQYQPVGSTETRTVNVRVISATNMDLEKMVNCGQFRSDLYYRLNVAELKVPPLKYRAGDIDILINYFIDAINRQGNDSISLSDETRGILQRYSWPGNVRELENTIKFLASVSDQTVITARSLPDSFLRRIVRSKNSVLQEESLSDVIESNEREVILCALDQFGKTVLGKKAAAKSLGISLATLYNKIKFHKI